MPLALSRRIGETIVINDDIKIKIVNIQGGQVKLSFEAPEDVQIDREELYLKKLVTEYGSCSPTTYPPIE